GRLLTEHPPADGAHIQVLLTPAVHRLVVPWAFLYAGEPPDPRRGVTVDPEAFWGLRYVIEQRFTDSYSSVRDEATVHLHDRAARWALFLNDQVGQVSAQHLRSLGELEGERLTGGTPPILAPRKLEDALRRSDHDVLYFFTHGHTAVEDPGVEAQVLDRLKDFAGQLGDEAGRGAERLEKQLLANRDVDGRSWIQMTRGRLFLDDLRDRDIRLYGRPLVFLNMCESAHFYTGTADNFIRFFLDRKARSVVGTECLMTPEFAHAFSLRVLGKLFRGEALGSALLAARRELAAELKSPLGMAYTLYGSAQLAFEPPAPAGSPAPADVAGAPETPTPGGIP
ncbi:MAG: hypothetical protein AAFY88_04085, partial [Acidobacteriota bacterium]